MVEANHLTAAELHAAMGTTEMPPLGGGGGGGVVRAPGPRNTAGAGIPSPEMSSMAPQMTTLPPRAMVSNGPNGAGSAFPPSLIGGSLPPNVRQVSPPHFAPNSFPHPLLAGGVSLQQFPAMYPPQQFPPQYYYRQQHQATAFPQANLSPEARMQLQHQQQAASARFLSNNATHVFAQAETVHLMAVKRVHIDKMKKEMMSDSGMNSAVSTSGTTDASAGGTAAMRP